MDRSTRRARSLPRTCAATLAASLFAYGMAAVAAVPASAAGSAVSKVSHASNPLIASRLAARQGSRVLIDDATTPTSQTWANPDGTQTARISAGPVRFSDGGGWRDVDTSLVTGEDGSLSPAAFGTSITLSGGGGKAGKTQDLVSVGSGKTAITWRWPDSLPTPSVTGSEATYADVQPNIDLVVAVRPTGIETYFVVKSRPTVPVALRLPMRLGGALSATAAKSGVVTYATADGTVVATTPPASRWSAAGSGSPTKVGSAPQSLDDTFDTSSGSPELYVAASQSYLQAADTQYPVVLDPGINLSSTYDTWIDEGAPSFSGGSATTDSVGAVSGSRTRTFMDWDDTAILGTSVSAATLNLYNTVADSPAQSWSIWSTGVAGAATTWSNQPSWAGSASATTSASNGASPGWVSTDVTALVSGWASGAAPVVGMGLRASPESATSQLQFSSINAAGNYPYISVTYDHYPNTPYDVSVANLHAKGATNYVNTLKPTFTADVTDPDGGTESAAFTLTDTTLGTTVLNKVTASRAGDGQVSYTVASNLTNNHSYSLQVWGYDGTVYSLSSVTTSFFVDTTAPASPSITSATYTAGAWDDNSGGLHTSGSFTFADSSTDVQSWYYSWNGAEVKGTSAGTCTSTCSWTATLTPPAGWNTLSAWAIDAAGNLSAVKTFSFGMGPAGVTAPTPNQAVSANLNVPFAGKVQLDATSHYAATQVTFQYEVPGGFWATIPAGNVTNNGSTLSAWPVSTYQVSGGLYAEAPRSGSGGTALSWDVAATLAALNDHATSQLLFVRAKFVQGANSWFSPYQPMTFNSATMDSSAATTGAGPCQVSLWTGSCEIDAADAAVTTAFGGVLGVDRTFVSSSIPTAGPFGPGWTASLPTDGADVNTLSFNGAEVTVQGPTTTVHFLWDGGSGFPLAPGETGNETLTAVGSGATAVFTFSEPADGGDGVKSDTQQVTFTAFYTSGTPSVSNPWVYKSAQTSPTGPAKSSSVVTTTFNATTGYPTQMLAPQPSGVTCNTTWAVGCEALNFTYNANNEITKVTLKTATSTGTAANTDLACYAYNASKQLTQVWDPRNVSSTCNYAAPVLPTTYAYDGSGRVVSVTPAGLAAWTIDYTSNRVADVKRTHSSAYGGATQQTSFVYNAPIGATSSANYPDLSAGTAATWGQYDLPVTGTAVFPPGTTASSTDLRPATVYAMDGNGDVVNVAGFNGTTQAGWAVSTTQYDELGNDVFDLSPQNRVYVTGSACAVAGLPTGCPSSILANALATISKYSGDGIDLTAVFSPTMTNVSLPNGIRGAARRRTSYSYGTVDYPYTTPSDYSTGGPAHDVIQQVEGASLSTVPYSTGEIGDLTTDYAYGLNSTDKAGWDYGSPESVITEMAGGSANYIVSQTKIDDATGMVVQTRQPSAAGVTSSPGTTVSTYYTVGTTNIANCVNTAWVGQLCKTAPGAQPTTSGLPGLPTTQATSYDYLLRPIVVTSTVTDAGGTQRTQTTTTSYDNGGVAGRVSSVVTTGGLGTSIPASTFYYDSSTGLPVVESNSVASSCVSAGPLCASYDDFGNQVGFTDTTGATTVISPTISDQPSTVTLKTPSGATVQTATYAYNGGSERRGLPTGLTYAGGSGYSSVGSYTASYDADGLLTAESLPDGSVMSQVADTNGQVTQKTWSSSSTLLWVEADDIYTIHGAVRQEGRPADGLFTTYSYDNAGRLGLAQEEYYDGQCTTRAYTLDKDSNRTGRDTFPPAVGGGCQSSGTPSASQSLSYDNADRLLSSGSASGVAYDAFGRMTSVPSSLVSGGSAVSVGYYTDDMVNTLTQGGVTQTWTLDPAGRDLASTQTGSSTATVNHFSALAGDSPSWSVVTSAGGVSATTVNDADLAGMLAATTSDTGSTMAITYQLTDARGDVLGTADPADPNELVTPVVADEFGNPTDIHGTTTTGPRYGWLGGHQRDASSISGVVLMGVRGYLPNVGRFVSVDPVPGGSANAYDYCDQDPINCLDLGGDRAHKKAHRIAKKIVQGFSYNSTFDAIVDIFNGRWHKAAKDFGLSNTVQFFQGLLSGKISKELAKEVGKELLKFAVKNSGRVFAWPIGVAATLIDDFFYQGSTSTKIMAPGPYRIPGLD